MRGAIIVACALALTGCGGDEPLRVCAGERAQGLELELVREIASRLERDVEISKIQRAVRGVLAGRCDVAIDRIRVSYRLQSRVAMLGYVQIDHGESHVRYGIVMPRGRDELFFAVRGALTTMNEDGTTKRLFREAGLRNAYVLGTA